MAATLGLLPRPTLKRCQATAPMRASFFDEDEDVRSSPEGCRVRNQVLTAYRNSPFRGEPFVLPNGTVVVEDTWEAALEVALDATVDQGMDALRDFSLERWLGLKVREDGTEAQRRDYENLISQFDMPPEPIDEGFRVGLPNDLTDVVHQPFQEIEVYRGLDDLVCEDVMPHSRSPENDGDDKDDVVDDRITDP